MLTDTPLIVIPDTHGQLGKVERLVAYFTRKGYLKDHRLAFLGDYVDRGPDVRGLVEYVMSLAADGHYCIAGNHEYVLDRVVRASGAARISWMQRWAIKYESATLQSYGVTPPFGKEITWSRWFEAADELRASMPESHRQFIAELPFFIETKTLLLVHAGLEPTTPWPAQRVTLSLRDRASARGPAQLFSHDLARTLEHPAPQTLVTGHVTVHTPLAAARRLLLSCGVDTGGPLAAWVSSENKCYIV